jgi:CheY-like chemotaxis protein
MSLPDPDSAAASSRPRAVVVDDNLLFTSALVPLLRSLGFEAASAGGGPATVERLATAPPEVLFVDLTAGRTDGAALVRELRRRPELAGTGIVGYAGHVERDRFAAGREAGCDLVVPNSAMRKALPEVLEKLRRRRAGAAVEEWPEEE